MTGSGSATVEHRVTTGTRGALGHRPVRDQQDRARAQESDHGHYGRLATAPDRSEKSSRWWPEWPAGGQLRYLGAIRPGLDQTV